MQPIRAKIKASGFQSTLVAIKSKVKCVIFFSIWINVTLLTLIKRLYFNVQMTSKVDVISTLIYRRLINVRKVRSIQFAHSTFFQRLFNVEDDVDSTLNRRHFARWAACCKKLGMQIGSKESTTYSLNCYGYHENGKLEPTWSIFARWNAVIADIQNPEGSMQKPYILFLDELSKWTKTTLRGNVIVNENSITMRKNKLKLIQRNTFSLLCVVASVVSVIIFFKEFSLFFWKRFAAGMKIRKPVKSYITSCFYCEFISDLFSFGGGAWSLGKTGKSICPLHRNRRSEVVLLRSKWARRRTVLLVGSRKTSFVI